MLPSSFVHVESNMFVWTFMTLHDKAYFHISLSIYIMSYNQYNNISWILDSRTTSFEFAYILHESKKLARSNVLEPLYVDQLMRSAYTIIVSIVDDSPITISASRLLHTWQCSLSLSVRDLHISLLIIHNIM